jgi:hypothetical protein
MKVFSLTEKQKVFSGAEVFKTANGKIRPANCDGGLSTGD